MRACFANGKNNLKLSGPLVHVLVTLPNMLGGDELDRRGKVLLEVLAIFDEFCLVERVLSRAKSLRS